VRIDKITKPMLAAFIDARLKDGLSPRSINVDVIALRNVLKKAANDGFLNALPTAGLKPMKVRTVKRPLLTPAQFEKLCTVARACSKNGDELVDYLKFLAFTGARCSEALRVAWADVDFDRRHVTIGADGLSKNGQARVVDFNPNLETHLHDMWQRRAPDTSWLFPSPQRGDRDIAARSLRDSFEIAREKAGLGWAGFHDLRHYFCSMSIMSGIDVRTIAEWMGHLDGGILIGKSTRIFSANVASEWPQNLFSRRSSFNSRLRKRGREASQQNVPYAACAVSERAWVSASTKGERQIRATTARALGCRLLLA
jgi:integrase